MGRSYATLNSFSFSTTILDNCILELGFLVYPTPFLSSRRNTLVYVLTRDVHRQGTMYYYSLGLHPHLPFTLRLMRGRQVQSKVEGFSFWLSNNLCPSKPVVCRMLTSPTTHQAPTPPLPTTLPPSTTTTLPLLTPPPPPPPPLHSPF